MSDGNTRRYRWIELAAIRPAGAIVRSCLLECDDARKITAWRDRFRNRDVFASLARFREPDSKSVYLADFFLDICSAGDLEKARRQAVAAIDLMYDRTGVLPESVEILFSGEMGFHLVIPLLVFGSPEVANFMPLWRAVAQRLKREGIDGIDMTGYAPMSLFRLPNSINSKTGLSAIPLEYKELRDFDAADIIELAQDLREEDALSVPEESDRATAWFRKALETFRRKNLQHKSVRTRAWTPSRRGVQSLLRFSEPKRMRT